MARYRKNLNYDYDDLAWAEDLDSDKTRDKVEYLQRLREHIDHLYPHAPEVVCQAPEPVQNGTFDDYIINVVYDRHALKGRGYSIVFYLEDFPVDSKQKPIHLGTIDSFSAPVSRCPNCKKQQEKRVLSRAQVPLTTALHNISQISASGQAFLTSEGGLNPDAVASMLHRHLQWQYVELGGRVRPKSHFPDTIVTVFKGLGVARSPDPRKATCASDPNAPAYGGYQKLATSSGCPVAGGGDRGGSNKVLPDDA